MFKTDRNSLEILSFAFNEGDIARFSALLGLMKNRNLLTLSREDVERLERGLKEIGKLKLDGKIYAFEVEDTYASRQGGDSGEGVELYRRQGDILREFRVNSDRDWVLKVDQVVPDLMRAGIMKVYTGPLTDSFLGLPKESDLDDPIYRSRLSDWNIDNFQDEGIEVVVLDKLI